MSPRRPTSGVRPQIAKDGAEVRRDAPDGAGIRLFMKAATALDHHVGWHRLPLLVSIPTLIGLRERLRRDNLFDPGRERLSWGPEAGTVGCPARRPTTGIGTDPEHADMGAMRTAFGRNVPLTAIDRFDDRFLLPDPKVISDTLLTRGPFIPATSLNMLAAAWVQFEVHDWMSHGRNDDDHHWELADGTKVRKTTHVEGDDPTTYRNEQTHWWDASQVYGSSRELAKALRTGTDGHLRLDDDERYPFDPPTEEHLPDELEGSRDAWWTGLSMFHTLFAREHNAICDRLAEAHPGHDDEWLYQKARLVNAALIAKIHTVEWSTAVLANPRTTRALRINWWGLQGERLHKRLGRRLRSDLASGIPGSDLQYHAVPYSLTEEFLSVYRMHPLIPEAIDIRSHEDGHVIERRQFEELAGRNTAAAFTGHSLADLVYSFATAHPGQLVLRNYPSFLRRLPHVGRGAEPNEKLDLAAIDILRDRERGVPRYNDFRRALRLAPLTAFEEFSDDPTIVAALCEAYDGNPELVDLMVGLYAEKKPDGFAFSDTAFRVFILMASRRLKSDPFFTRCYDEHNYTEEGLAWVMNETMSSVLGRHVPELRSVLAGVTNPFAPWDSPLNRQGAKRWGLKQKAWNTYTRTKFLLAEPLHVPVPTADRAVGERPFTEAYPSIPIHGLVVADRFPADEDDPMVATLIRAEELAARLAPPAATEEWPIDANPRVALKVAYGPAYQRRYRAPRRPLEYDSLDLGRLALSSPYTYLLEHVDGATYRWDLERLNAGYELHKGLKPPGVEVTFTRDGDELTATAIEGARQRFEPDTDGWAAAQRLAMCAAATHVTLIRHFNWIHLVAGERLALATNRLPYDHRLRRLLAPHVFATHFGNRIVTPLQLAPGGDFERLFSYTHKGLCQLFEDTARDFDLQTMNPDRAVEVHEIPVVVDGALANRTELMHVIRTHVGRYLGEDGSVGDPAVQRWVDELSVMEGVRQLADGSPPTLEGLVELVATFIYMVSVEHEIVDSAVWDYHLWSDVSAPRVYEDGRRMPIDLYQRLVNNNFILNVDRTRLWDDFSYLAVDDRGRDAFHRFSRDLHDLQDRIDHMDPITREQGNVWRIEPRSLKANINY